MFTGIITSVEKVKKTSQGDKNISLWISTPHGWKLKLGESISVDGICSTVKRLRKNIFEVEYMPETLKRTTAPKLREGASVNLERSLRVSDRLDGHLIQGHVDATGKVKKIKRTGTSAVIEIGFPKQYRKFIAEKGSVCVNGVSLTVVAVSNDWFTVSLVSYTLGHTNLGGLKKKDKVNIEVDILARYIDALLK